MANRQARGSCNSGAVPLSSATMSNDQPRSRRAATAAVEAVTNRVAADPAAEERLLWDAAILTLLERGAPADGAMRIAGEIIYSRRELFGTPSE